MRESQDFDTDLNLMSCFTGIRERISVKRSSLPAIDSAESESVRTIFIRNDQTEGKRRKE